MTLPTPTYIGVRADSLAALLNVLNIALPDAAELVAEGELAQGTVDTATGAFDELADRLDGLFGPTWIEDEEGGSCEATATLRLDIYDLALLWAPEGSDVQARLNRAMATLKDEG